MVADHAIDPGIEITYSVSEWPPRGPLQKRVYELALSKFNHPLYHQYRSQSSKRFNRARW